MIYRMFMLADIFVFFFFTEKQEGNCRQIIFLRKRAVIISNPLLNAFH